VERHAARRAARARSPCPSRCGARRPRDADELAVGRKRPVACRPPVRSNVGCTRRSGSAASSAAGTAADPPEAGRERGRPPPPGRPCRTHRTTRWCRSAARPGRGERAGHLDGVDRQVGGRPGGVRAVEEAFAEQEPERQLLVVAGVRIVTASGLPSTRISSGSSTATRSSNPGRFTSACAPRTWTRVAEGSAGIARRWDDTPMRVQERLRALPPVDRLAAALAADAGATAAEATSAARAVLERRPRGAAGRRRGRRRPARARPRAPEALAAAGAQRDRGRRAHEPRARAAGRGRSRSGRARRGGLRKPGARAGRRRSRVPPRARRGPPA
jgi:hypothetical protein